MSGLEIALLLIGLVFIGGTFTVIQVVIERKYREAQQKNDDRFWDLMDEFTEKNYTPCVVDDTPGTDAEVFKQELIKTYYRRGK